jgi:hypothetical protein
MSPCKSPLCRSPHHQYPTTYPFPWASSHMSQQSTGRSTSSSEATPIPLRSEEVHPSQPDTHDLFHLPQRTAPLSDVTFTMGAIPPKAPYRRPPFYHLYRRVPPSTDSPEAIWDKLARDAALAIFSGISPHSRLCMSPVNSLTWNLLPQPQDFLPHLPLLQPPHQKSMTPEMVPRHPEDTIPRPL